MYVWGNSPMIINVIFFCFTGFWQGAAAPLSRTSPRRPGRFQRTQGERRTNIPKMNTIVFNKLSSQVLFEEKANEVERSSRNYLEVIDGQHPDLLASSPVIKDSSAIRHRRSGYVTNFSVFYKMYCRFVDVCPTFKKKSINYTPEMKQMLCIIFSSCFIKWNICFHQFHSIFLIRNLIRNGLKIERFITAYCHISTASFKGWIFSQWMITALHIIYFSGRNNQPNYSVKILSRKKRGKKPWI